MAAAEIRVRVTSGLKMLLPVFQSVKQLGGVWIEQMIRESMGEEISKGFNPTQAAPITYVESFKENIYNNNYNDHFINIINNLI